jgi:hypothetical protein
MIARLLSFVCFKLGSWLMVDVDINNVNYWANMSKFERVREAVSYRLLDWQSYLFYHYVLDSKGRKEMDETVDRISKKVMERLNLEDKGNAKQQGLRPL